MEGKIFLVDKIMGMKEEGGQLLYKVRWANYGARYDSWEPVENLGDCHDLIGNFLELSGPKRRLRKRVPPPESPAVHFSSDDEQPVPSSAIRSTRKSLARKARRKSPVRQVRTRQSIATTTAPKKEQSKHEEESVPPSVEKKSQKSQVVQPSEATDSGLITKTYELRSLSRRHEATKLMQLSSDEEAAIAGSRDTTHSPPKPRMSLREHKFRKQLADIHQPTGSPQTLPQLQPVSMHVTTHVKTRLQFESSDTNAKKAPPKLTARQPEPTPPQETIVRPPIQLPQQQQQPCEPGTARVERQEAEDERRRVPNWLQIGCAEVGFAVFVTLVASFGYFCWTSEYC